MASLIAGAVGRKAYSILAKDRNVLIPLDNIKGTQVLTDKQLENKFCKMKMKPKTPARKGKTLKSNLERVLERF